MPQKNLISVVDDDESVREAMRGLMKSLGYSVETFASAESFLASDHAKQTGCLVADVQMPGMTGMELYSQLLSAEQPIPTVLITAHPNETARACARKAGVICYLPKPFRVDELLVCISAALGQQHKGTSA